MQTAITREFKTIVSQSGTTHYVNPAPRYSSSGSGALAAGRTQTLCEMHLKPDSAASPTGEMCQFCETQSKGAKWK